MTHDETLAAILKELAEQRQEMSSLRAEVRRLQAAQAATAPASEIATAPQTASEDDAPPLHTSSKAQRGGTSRRGLLRGAAAGAAAAAVAAVAVGGTEQAHAASEATGDNFILGQNNDANATTSLSNSTSSTPGTVLSVTSSQSSAIVIYAAAMSTGTAIYGTSSGYGAGVTGDSPGANSSGVLGTSLHGFGVQGQSSSGIDIGATGSGVMLQSPQSAAGAPSSGTYSAGESIRDSNGELWLCVAGGTPGTWVLVSHAQVGYLGGAINYLSKPIRLLDTRLGYTDANQNNGHNPCSSTAPTTVNVAGVTYNSVSVPASAVGAIGNVTVLADKAAGGFLAVVPSGAGFTGTANMAYVPAQTVSNAFNVGLGSGNLDIILGAGSADVIVDLFAFVS